MLAAEGLLRFYDLGGGAGSAVGSAPRAAACDWLPELEAKATTGEAVRLTLDVQGLRCAACVWLLQTVFERVPGALDLRVAPSLGQATLLYRAGSGAAPPRPGIATAPRSPTSASTTRPSASVNATHALLAPKPSAPSAEPSPPRTTPTAPYESTRPR
jgi:hypothetical protein